MVGDIMYTFNLRTSNSESFDIRLSLLIDIEVQLQQAAALFPL